MFLVGIWRRNTQPYLLMGWTWFYNMLLPVIGLVQVGSQAMADRYTYLPSIGLFIAVVWGMAEIAARSSSWRAIVATLGTVSLLVFVFDTRYQLGFWRDNITLFQHVAHVSPKDNYLGNFYLGISYGELGELDSAARCLTSAVEANPRFELARSRLGNVLLVQKKYAAAEPFLESEAKIHPEDIPARVTLGMALAGQQKYAAAQSEYQAAHQLDPDNPVINQILTANTPKADAELALPSLTNQLNISPTPEAHANVAIAQATLGRYSEAVQQYKLALAQKPDSAEYLNNLAWILATCPDDAVRNGAEAVKFAQKACEQTQYKRTVFIGTLAAACAEAGQFDAAMLNTKKACDNASAQGETDLLELNQKFLTLYQNHHPYREATDTPIAGENK
jgi:tetratricopeptide (TPR) repeat protein